MLFYLIVILCSFGLMYLAEKTGRSWLYYAGTSVLMGMTALRFDVGMDFEQYFEMEVPELDEITLYPEGDGFNRLGILVKVIYLFADWCGCRQIVFVAAACVTFIFTAIAIKRHSRDVIVSWSVFVAFLLSHSFNLIWQVAAASMVYFAMRFVADRQPWKFIAMVLLAAAIHSSALLALVIYPIYRHVKFEWILIAGISGLLIKPFVSDLLNVIPHYSAYVQDAYEAYGGGKLMYLYPTMVAGTWVIWYFHGGRDGGDAGHLEFPRLLSVIVIGIFPMFFLTADIGSRIGFYFTLLLMFAIPQALVGCRILSGCAIAGFVSLFFITIYLYQQSDRIYDTHVPYKCCLFTDSSDIRERRK